MPNALTSGIFEGFADDRLVWLPELEIGYYPVTASPYDRRYWNRYREQDATDMGRLLTEARVGWVRDHHREWIVDVGIGGGRFVEECPRALGFDINPNAVDWLKDRDCYFDPYVRGIEAASFWDSLEHIHNPGPLLRNITRRVFVSVPIFENAEHVIHSKHFRKDEHCWYFTAQGLAKFMRRFGFELRDSCRVETDLGREDIGTFYFERPTK